jgi:hypothetical protein
MGFDEDRLQHRFVTEPRAHPVGKDRQPFTLLLIPAAEIGLADLQIGGLEHGKADEVETITGIDRRFGRRQPFMEKPPDNARLAHRARRADGDAADVVVARMKASSSI